jgi:tRNA-specific 2-thiouridylase
VAIEADTRRVVLGAREELARHELTAAGANWLTALVGGEGSQAMPCQVKIRYRSRSLDALVEVLPGDRFQVRFHNPCYAVAPGQAAVCYKDDRVLGGGWIE